MALQNENLAIFSLFLDFVETAFLKSFENIMRFVEQLQLAKFKFLLDREVDIKCKST